MKKVGIIGGAGFIGSYLTKVFLENGYQVKVSTTDISKPEKYKHLPELDQSGNLYITELSTESKNQLQQFMQDCDIAIHCGTPFQLDVKEPQTELFEPTINGTKNFLEVVSHIPSIEKVVFIASVAAYNTNFPLPPDNKATSDNINEKSTKFISAESHPYAQAKFLANKIVEKFIDEHSDLHFEISAVSPVMVFGKSLSSRKDSTSTGLQYIFKNNLAPNDFIRFLYNNNALCAIVDVRDVADAVFKTSTTTGLHGKNYLLSNQSWKVLDIQRMMNGESPQSKPVIVYENHLAKADLKMQFRPVCETLFNYSQ